MTPQTIALIAGAAFILIAVIGGGFTVKELSVPPVPKAARIVSGIVGALFIAYSLLIPFLSSVPRGNPPPLPPSNVGGPAAIYTDDQISVSQDSIRVSGLGAISEHNPPLVNDRITIQFTLQNDGQRPVVLRSAFVGARNPANANKDFGEGYYEKVLAPSEAVNIKSSILVTEKGVWKFWPCYAIENTFCPDEWRAFQVLVVEP